MAQWEDILTPQHWSDLVKHHREDVESLPALKNYTFYGTYTPDLLSLVVTPTHPNPNVIHLKRDPRTGKHLYFEELCEEDTQSTGKGSHSLKRALAKEDDNPKGSAGNTFFWPGGISDSEDEDEDEEDKIDFENDLLTTPPGFVCGMEFEKDIFQEDEGEEDDIIELIAKLDEAMISERAEKKRKVSTKVIPVEEIVSEEEEEGNEGEKKRRFMWAVEVDAHCDVPDFYTKLVNLAYQFPFELDPFQKQAILKLHKHENVMVAAHTSAGKTVIAEYAIALARHHMTKVIYTSPIKALSNQKFRDFKNKFGEVGLLTGDLQVNTDAPCLIMTTEILRSMLYNGSDITRDLEWVIFDEVHYINNLERGVVWEEVLIMLPAHVSVILLSATVANVNDFAEWVGNTKRKKVYVITTPKRPVPLEHNLYTGNSDKTSSELFTIISADKKAFNVEEFERAKQALASRKKSGKDGGKRPPNGGKLSKQADRNLVLSFIRMLERENKLPVVMFILSKVRINELAASLNNLDLTINKEKGAIREFISRCITRLKGSDKQLPQILFLTELMCRGIAIHHSGVLPLIREVTEMLFEKGLLKLLLATETFAMGINMPTKTVVFDSVMKFDGERKRLFETSEYIQMAGRAGRRGLDETGTVIILCKGQMPDYNDLIHMVQGKVTDLSSHFKPNYNMILSVLKGKDLKVEEMLKRSFAEYENQLDSRSFKKEKKELEEKLSKLRNVQCMVCREITVFYKEAHEMMDLERRFKEDVLNTYKVAKHLHPGKVIIVSTPSHKYNIGVIVSVVESNDDSKKFSVVVIGDDKKKDEKKEEEKEVISDPAIIITNKIMQSPGVHGRVPGKVSRPQSVSEIAWDILTIQLSDIACVLTQKLSNDMTAMKRSIQMRKFNPRAWNSMLVDELAKELFHMNQNDLKEIHYDVRDVDLVDLKATIERQRDIMKTFHITSCPEYSAHLLQASQLCYARAELKRLDYALSYQSMHFMPEFEVRVKVLRRLGYLSTEDQLKLKGKAACAMSTSELVITELVFDNFFKDLPVENIVAILSCMVFQQRRCSEPELTADLLKAKGEFLRLAHKIVQAEVEEKLRGNDADFDKEFRFGLVEVVWRWARGEEFSAIMKYTDVDEGTIVRCITRLDEVLRCIKDVARIVGDVDFEAKMERASTAIKRDIVFAASLYVQ